MGSATQEKQDKILKALGVSNPDADISSINTGVLLQNIGSNNYDSFSRLRVSEPQYVFDAQLTYDLQPLLFEQVTAESGATITHDATNRCATLSFSNTPTGGEATMVSYEHFRYQPGRSQLIFVTFNFIEDVANATKYAGYFDGVNGVIIEHTAGEWFLKIQSATAYGSQIVAQSAWSGDKLDGTGESGHILDIGKTQIFAIDFQALYVGRVRCYMDIDGELILLHEFKHANKITFPYIQTANLPISCGMTCSDTVTTSMMFICSSVISEGGQQDVLGFPFAVEGTATAGNGADTHILSIQPKTTFNSLTNRTKIILESFELTVTGSNPIIYKLCIGQALTGTALTDVNTTYSGVQTITGTLSGSPLIVIAQGYVAATNQSKQAISKSIPARYPITLDLDGAARNLGRLTMLVQGIGGTSATRCTFNWTETR